MITEIEKVPSEVGIPSPGHLLAEKREEYGWSIRDVAVALRLSERQVEALETDEYESLPGKTYVMGYWRSYSQLLKLSIEDSIQVHRMNLFGEVSDISIKPGGKEVRAHDERSRKHAAVLFAFLLALALGAIWYWQSPDVSLSHWLKVGMERLNPEAAPNLADTVVGGLPAAVVDRVNGENPGDGQVESVLALPVPNFSENEGEQTIEINTRGYEVVSLDFPLSTANLFYQSSLATDPEISEAGNLQAAEEQSAVADNNSAANTAVIPQASTTTAEPEAQPVTDTPAVENQLIVAAPDPVEEPAAANTSAGRVNNLVFKVDKESWIDVRDSSGERLIYRTVNRGEDIQLKGSPPYSVFIGTAEGVQVEYQGELVPFTVHESGLFARFEVGT